MKTEYFEKFIDSLSLVEGLVCCLTSIYTGVYAPNSTILDEKSEEEFLDSLASEITYLFTKYDKNLLRDETLFNIQECCNNPLFLANHYIDRIVEQDLTYMTKIDTFNTNELEYQFLTSSNLSKQLSALNYIYQTESESVSYAYIDPPHNVILMAVDRLNDFLAFLYKKFLSISVDIIPLCVKNNIHIHEYDPFDGSYIREMTTEEEESGRSNTFALPEELNTPKARKLLDRAVEYKLLQEGYKWSSKLMTKRELAYLCYALSNKLELSSIMSKAGDGRNETNWKPFKELFNDNNLNNNLRGTDTPTETMERIGDVYKF